MRFLDSNIVLYAYLKPKKGVELPDDILERKAISKKIVERIEKGLEDVIISTVHLAEILNIISAKLGVEKSILFLAKILTLKNVKIMEVSKDTYKRALEVSMKKNIEPNDAVAIVIMRDFKCDEIYTFDSDFLILEDINPVLLRRGMKEET